MLLDNTGGSLFGRTLTLGVRVYRFEPCSSDTILTNLLLL